MSKPALLLFLAMSFSLLTKSNAQSPKAITLEEAISIGLQNNNGVKAAQYTIDQSRFIKSTSTEIGKTSASLMYGQYNSYYNDNSITISQSIPFPTYMRNQAKHYEAASKSLEYRKKVTENELKSNIRSVYNYLLYFKAKGTLLLSQDTIFATFLRSAELRLKTGESNALEKSIAESQLYELRNQRALNESDIAIYENQLQTLLNSSEKVTSQSSSLSKITSDFNSDSLSTTGNPSLQYFNQQINVSQAARNVERSRLFPDISLGYFNQTLYGTQKYNDLATIAGRTNRFQGVILGLAFPLWAKPQLARVKAGQAGRNAAKAEYEFQKTNLDGEYKAAYQEFLKYKNSLDYYEQKALSTADAITINALKNYRSGNIGYMEFSNGLSRALSIKSNYLDILNQYNQSVIHLEFLVGNK